ncbi:nucleotidyltransferase domain-containing protein [Haloarcula sp. JP-L23]|uniref:type VII toxin-antitoxin system MntA family adenylyltransferase antitoxin n=1 Tax=Haloarcula sp. JP-L23 TaxID=2716717 RepID=UPI00140F1D24|nr:nucleotidyltransferase domain-containing protein [Haloarcula sp. JP-L23]
MSEPSESGDVTVDIDVNRITEIVMQQPVRLAVLYGSHVRGTATSDSDVDIAIAFEGERSSSERLERRVDLTVALSKALGTDSVDVADLDSIRPSIGQSALRTGIVLVGDQDTVSEYLERFERERDTEQTHDERMRRFDSILGRLEETV